MGSKLILLLGLIVGGLLTVFCVDKDKREVILNYKNSYFNQAKVSDVAKVENIIIQEIPKETKSFPTLIDREEVSLGNVSDIENIEEKITILLKDNPIYFQINSSTIHEDSQKGLMKIFGALKELPRGTVVTVEGHTDAIGNASFNKKLSQKRADSVKFYLKKGGLNHLTIKSKGYGEEKPLVSNPNDKKNRRVEINLKRGE